MKFCATLHSDKVDLGEEFVSGAGIAAVARSAEDAGFDTVFVTEHPFPSDTYLANGGHHALDPFVTLAVAAAATSRLRVLTHLCVVPYHNPYVLAKTALTVDVLSGGRLIFGCGAGYQEPEFAAVGTSFADRNERFERAIAEMKQAWSAQSVQVAESGTGHTMRPAPVHQPHPPIWIGGNSRTAIRRAVELGDGWMPFPNTPSRASFNRTPQLDSFDVFKSRVALLREAEDQAGRKLPDLMFSPVGVDSYGTDGWDPVAFRQLMDQYDDLGVTMTLVYIPATSRDEYCRLLARFGQEFIQRN
jgi:probable F420-dependent oxidoreductase